MIDHIRSIINHKEAQAARHEQDGFPLLARETLREIENYKFLIQYYRPVNWSLFLWWRQ